MKRQLLCVHVSKCMCPCCCPPLSLQEMVKLVTEKLGQDPGTVLAAMLTHASRFETHLAVGVHHTCAVAALVHHILACAPVAMLTLAVLLDCADCVTKALLQTTN